MMEALGIMLLLFSTGVFGIPFRYFVAQWWPVFLVFLGLSLIMIYVYKQHSVPNEKVTIIEDYDDDD